MISAGQVSCKCRCRTQSFHASCYIGCTSVTKYFSLLLFILSHAVFSCSFVGSLNLSTSLYLKPCELLVILVYTIKCSLLSCFTLFVNSITSLNSIIEPFRPFWPYLDSCSDSPSGLNNLVCLQYIIHAFAHWELVGYWARLKVEKASEKGVQVYTSSQLDINLLVGGKFLTCVSGRVVMC